MAAVTVLSAAVRSGVLAVGIGLAALAIPQLLDTAAAETTDAAPASAASTTGAVRPAAAARPAGPKARAARAGGAPAATPAAPAPTATRTTAVPAATRATTWTPPLPARPRYRSPESPAAAAPRPGEPLLRGVDGTYVYFYNRTDQTLAVVQVPNGGRNDPETDPRYVAPGEKSDFYGDNNGIGKMDVRLRIYSATQDDTGAWQKVEMKEIITATNRLFLSPYARVQMDPKREGSGFQNRFLEKGFSVNDNWFADYDLKGPTQSGQTGTFMLRLSDRDDDYKVFQIEVFKIPQGSTQDYDLVKSTEGG